MSQHNTFFSPSGFAALTETFFGETATYQAAAGGDPVLCQVVVTRDVVVQPNSYDSTTVMTGDVIEALISVVGAVSEDDTFIVGTVTYTAIRELENNGAVTKWVCK